MRNTLRIITTAAILTLTTLPLSAAIYMKIEGIKGNVTAEGHRDWIELESVQFMVPSEGNATLKQATLTCRKSGTIEATARIPPQVKAVLAGPNSARTVLPEVIVEVNGQTHSLRNATVVSAQPMGDGMKLVLNFAQCATHAAPDHKLGGGNLAAPPASSAAKTYDHTLGGGSLATNVKLIGAGATPVAIQLESLTINGTGARVAFAKELTGTLILSSHQKLPTLVVEMSNGQKWTFYEVVMEDVLISSATNDPKGSRPTDSFSINFSRVEGPATGFQARR
jgi:type VI protein secretion system component Hcp